MAIHVVKQGECLSSIAAKYGFVDWRTIYDHPNNTDIKQQRPDPNLLFPGDQLFIPPRETKHEAGGTESKHRFTLKATKTLLRLRLQDQAWAPLGGIKWRLQVAEHT